MDSTEQDIGGSVSEEWEYRGGAELPCPAGDTIRTGEWVITVWWDDNTVQRWHGDCAEEAGI